MKKYKHLLVSGCSFTQDGIGGTPPGATSDGSCSFNTDPDYAPAEPATWPGFLARLLKITSLVNTASSAHGNLLVANTLLTCIQKYRYTPEDSLIVFNLSDPARFDLICGYDNAHADGKNIPWDPLLVDYSFVNRRSKIMEDLEKYLGAQYIEQATSNCVDFLLHFLQNKKFDFYFMTMNDYSQTCLAPVINQFRDHLIELDPGSSMIEYCQRTGTRVSASDFHPNVQGHQMIADQIFQFLQTNAI